MGGISVCLAQAANQCFQMGESLENGQMMHSQIALWLQRNSITNHQNQNV